LQNRKGKIRPIGKILGGLIILRMSLYGIMALANASGVFLWDTLQAEPADHWLDLFTLTPALLVIVINRKRIPRTLGPLTFGFRAGFIWWMASILLALNQFGFGMEQEAIAFIGAEVTRTAFFCLFLIALASRWSSENNDPRWLGWMGVALVGLTFFSQLGLAFGGLPFTPLISSAFSIFSFISGTIAAWMLAKERF
jgi:hypothetical protein